MSQKVAKLSEVKAKLGNFIKVENLTSSRGNDVPNQFRLRFENGTVFQSYDSTIAISLRVFGEPEQIYLTPHWDYSKTTGKYRNSWLGEDIKETSAKIKSGEYILTDSVS